MKAWLAALAALTALGCEIAPVVTNPNSGGRYSDCGRAAQDYCELVLKKAEEGMEACDAEYRFKCVSSGARSSGISRS